MAGRGGLPDLPRSFADSNGDGVGDLPGVTSRLEHVAALGADAVWLTPFQRSPQADHGYDVSDYLDVDPLFGTLADFDALIARAHDLALRVIVDLVPNHCSSAHPAFQAALAAGPGALSGPGSTSPADAARVGTSHPTTGPASSAAQHGRGSPSPTACRASGTSTCMRPSSPTGTGGTRPPAEILDAALCFWLDRGADGVRIDVAHGLYKADGLPDLVDTRVGPMAAAGQPAGLRPGGGARGVPPVAGDRRRLRARRRVLVGEVNLLSQRGPSGTSAPTSSTRPSPSRSSPRPGTPRAGGPPPRGCWPAPPAPAPL